MRRLAAVLFLLGLLAATPRVVADDPAPPAGWSFRNHVLPVLTRAGCNAGACHGAAAGKGDKPRPRAGPRRR